MLANLVFGLHMELQNVLCAQLDHTPTILGHLNVQNARFQDQLTLRVQIMNYFVKVFFYFTKPSLLSTSQIQCFLLYVLNLIYIDFDLWLTDEESKVYLDFQTAHFVKNFIVSFWIQSDSFSISMRSVRKNVSMNYSVNKTVSGR